MIPLYQGQIKTKKQKNGFDKKYSKSNTIIQRRSVFGEISFSLNYKNTIFNYRTFSKVLSSIFYQSRFYLKKQLRSF